MASIECPNCTRMTVALGKTGVCDGCENIRASQPPPKAKPVSEVQAFLARADEEDAHIEHELARPSRPPLTQCLGDILKMRLNPESASTPST